MMNFLIFLLLFISQLLTGYLIKNHSSKVSQVRSIFNACASLTIGILAINIMTPNEKNYAIIALAIIGISGAVKTKTISNTANEF